MSRVKGKDSKIETLFRKELWKQNFRYRKNSSGYFGKPDLVLPKYKTVIFIDSCFWHGCKKHCRMPSSNVAYWIHKIERNKNRDKQVNNFYRKRDGICCVFGNIPLKTILEIAFKEYVNF